MHPGDVLGDIASAIIGATACAIISKLLRQPLILGYLVAGVALGPKIGFGIIHDEVTINTISEIGLILLLFIVGLEIELKRLFAGGRMLVLSGICQFPLCTALGCLFFLVPGFSPEAGRFDVIYLAVAVSLSSTMIVVKLLYDKYELFTLPGRITLGVLVFQDIWAILFLSLQPTLASPSATSVAFSCAKGAGLIACSMLASRYLLGRLFAFIAKVPEILLVTSIAWCFLLSGIAGSIGLSRAMGALIAGVSLSAFPYNIDVIAKVINIRDFFVTLFFVGLGLQIPIPDGALLGCSVIASAFLVLTRFLSVFSVLYLSGSGLRLGILPSVNLSQMSEFSLVIASLGFTLGHIGAQTVTLITFAFVLTSVCSTYMIQYNHQIQKALTALLKRVGLKDGYHHEHQNGSLRTARDVVFLGFFREASSIFHELEVQHPEGERFVQQHVKVIDFNPTVYFKLSARGIACMYGDISNIDTLLHAHIASARVVVCALSDAILRGTTNEKLLLQIKRLCPHARIIVTAITIASARRLYEDGADFVYMPRIHAADYVAQIIIQAMNAPLDTVRDHEMRLLSQRNEIID
ncbi:MAG: cation:proton antiporter [Desulfobacterota bacterium]|nr:cation:proton antiporter [Thermodesulfobacteriota bacterium]